MYCVGRTGETSTPGPSAASESSELVRNIELQASRADKAGVRAACTLVIAHTHTHARTHTHTHAHIAHIAHTHNLPGNLHWAYADSPNCPPKLGAIIAKLGAVSLNWVLFKKILHSTQFGDRST